MVPHQVLALRTATHQAPLHHPADPTRTHVQERHPPPLAHPRQARLRTRRAVSAAASHFLRTPSFPEAPFFPGRPICEDATLCSDGRSRCPNGSNPPAPSQAVTRPSPVPSMAVTIESAEAHASAAIPRGTSSASDAASSMSNPYAWCVGVRQPPRLTTGRAHASSSRQQGWTLMIRSTDAAVASHVIAVRPRSISLEDGTPGDHSPAHTRSARQPPGRAPQGHTHRRGGSQRPRGLRHRTRDSRRSRRRRPLRALRAFEPSPRAPTCGNAINAQVRGGVGPPG